MKNQETDWLFKEKYQGLESEAFWADCARLADGVPLGYLIGHVPFLDCIINLDSHPLIPRPETEYWVERAITAIELQTTRQDFVLNDGRGLASSLKILDLCAGSGAIGVAVAKAIPDSQVTFAELDPAHLPTIEKNYYQNVKPSIRMEGRTDSINELSGSAYTLVTSNLFSALTNGERFDYILTNPPYIDAEANTVAANVVEHEPHLALFGGEAGMEIIARIIAEAPYHLTRTGQLWIEHEPAHVESITSLAQTHGFSIITHPDQYQVPRFSVLTMAQ